MGTIIISELDASVPGLVASKFNDANAEDTISFEFDDFTVFQALKVKHSDITVKHKLGETVTITTDLSLWKTEFSNRVELQRLLVQGVDSTDSSQAARVIPEETGTDWKPLVTDAQTGLRAITVEDGGGFAVGDTVYIKQNNDTDYIDNVSYLWQQQGAEYQGSAVPFPTTDDPLREFHTTVEAVVGNTVILRDALPYDFEASKSKVAKTSFLSGIKIENLHFTYSTGAEVLSNNNYSTGPRVGEVDVIAGDPLSSQEWRSVAAVHFNSV